MITFPQVDLTYTINMVWNSIVYFFISAVVVLFFLSLGFFVAKYVNKIVRFAFKKSKVEDRIKSLGLEKALAGFNLTEVATTFLKVYIVFAFLGAAAEIINVGFFTQVIASIMGYLPSLFQGIIVIVGVLFIASYVTNTIKRQRTLFAEELAFVMKLLIAYVGIILALPLFLPNLAQQIMVLERLLELFMSALFVAFGLAVGLGFGLGIKDAVAKSAKKHQHVFDGIFGHIAKKKGR